jgi:hypothetical protein
MSGKTFALVAGLAIALSVPVMAADQIVPPSVPSEIAVSGSYKPFFVGHAIGTQNFICVPAPTTAGVDWVFIGPQATLFDNDLEQVATHFHSVNPESGTIQAAWQSSKDTGAVWATLDRESVDPNYVRPDAISWLRLLVSGKQAGPLGGNKLTSAKYIHRVNTIGGKKPALSECTSSVFYTRRLVYYEADYYFYR